MLGIRTIVLIYFIVLPANLLYSQDKRAQRTTVTARVADLNGVLSGLNVPGYGSAACAAGYPASTRMPCFPIDSQTVAYGLSARNPINVTTLHKNGMIFDALPVRIDWSIPLDVLIGGIVMMCALCLVLLIKNKTRGLLDSPFLREHSFGEKFMIENAIEDPLHPGDLGLRGNRWVGIAWRLPGSSS